MLSEINIIGDSVSDNINSRGRNEKGRGEILQRMRLCFASGASYRFLDTTTFVVLVQLTDVSLINKLTLYIFRDLKFKT